MKLDETICILPHCEEIQLLVERDCPFCIEHSTKFKDFSSRYEISREIDNLIKIDKEFREEFLTDVVYDFFDEEEKKYHKKAKPALKKKKKTKKKRKRK